MRLRGLIGAPALVTGLWIVAAVPAGGAVVAGPAAAALVMEYRGAWGAGLLARFVLHPDGRYVWRGRADAQTPPHFLRRSGHLDPAQVRALMREVEALPRPAYRAFDAPTVTLRRGAGAPREKVCYVRATGPCAALVERIERLAEHPGRGG